MAYQSAALSCIASVAYIGGVAEVQQHSDMPLLAALIANRDETVRAYANPNPNPHLSPFTLTLTLTLTLTPTPTPTLTLTPTRTTSNRRPS